MTSLFAFTTEITVPDTVPVSVTEPVGGAAGVSPLPLLPPPLPQEARATTRTASATLLPIDRIQDSSEDIMFLF
jgi:hypothetical protein